MIHWWDVKRPSYLDEFEVVWPHDMRTFAPVRRGPPSHQHGQYARKANKRNACRAWLDVTLEREPLTSGALKLEAKRAGYSTSTLKTALRVARHGDAPTIALRFVATEGSANVVYYRRPVSVVAAR